MLILQSKYALHFIIKFPVIKFACKKITIVPVSHEGAMLRLDDGVIAECNNEIYTVKACTASTTFCQLSS